MITHPEWGFFAVPNSAMVAGLVGGGRSCCGNGSKVGGPEEGVAE